MPARVEETVKMRLMSDVPLGMFLSGGIDSSTIAALMKRMVADPEQKIKTFSVGYREVEYSELGFARELATEINTDHHEVTLGMEDFFNQLPRLIWHEDEPIVWPSSVSLYFVSKLAAEEVKVVLTGRARTNCSRATLAINITPRMKGTRRFTGTCRRDCARAFGIWWRVRACCRRICGGKPNIRLSGANFRSNHFIWTTSIQRFPPMNSRG